MPPSAPRTRILAASLLALATLTSGSRTQQTLVVGAGGTFPTISAAIAAAQPGDTVLVNGGTWAENLDIDKGIHFVGRGASLRYQIFQFPMRVHDVPAGQVFSMRGFRADGSSGATDTIVQVDDCDGTVAIQHLEQGGLNQWALRAVNSRQVHVAGTAIAAMRCQDSTVVIHGCVFDPGVLAGLTLDGGRVAIVGCSIRGAFAPFTGPGIHMTGTELAIAASQVTGTGSSAAILTSGGVILNDPSNVLAGAGSSPAIAGNAQVAVYEFGTLQAATDGQTLSMTVNGPTGSAFVTLLSLPRPVVPTPSGLAWVDPLAFAIVQTGTLAGAVPQVGQLAHPTLPPGVTAALQMAYVGPSGVALSTPSLVIAP